MAAVAANPAEPSTSSSCLSNGTSTPAKNLSPTNLEIAILSKLSSHLVRLLLDAADPGILVARSHVFRDLFSASAVGSPSGSRAAVRGRRAPAPLSASSLSPIVPFYQEWPFNRFLSLLNLPRSQVTITRSFSRKWCGPSSK
ncbi:extensin-1-like [Iris pallida]|uniref:Extensin-1-like n=1 Tax=Iris pallida TaxID=29817 RepID=A0AAX6GKN0_IRIPA|nr:extensin-1-like [Iris pallida]